MRGIVISGDDVEIGDILSQLNGQNGGRGPDIDIRARALSAPNIRAEAGQTGPGGAIRIAVDGTLSAGAPSPWYGDPNAASIETVATGAGRAGDVTIDAHDIHMESGRIGSRTLDTATGDTGNVHLAATGQLTIASGAVITTSTSSARGRAGQIEVSGGQVDIGGGGIMQVAAAGSSGLTGGSQSPRVKA
jgi:hypothetical protein